MAKPGNDPVATIRTALNTERIKLWEPPYTKDDGSKGTYPDGFVQRYANELRLDVDQVSSILEQLRKHSVEKLASRRNSRGVTTLLVKIAGKLKLEKVEYPTEISLQSLGSELKEMVSASSGIPADRLKLIGCGHVIVNDISLFEQHIRPDSQIMAMVLSESEVAAKAHDEEQARLKEARQDAELISTQSSGETDDEYYVQIADQSGNPLNLPHVERKALALAMTLHERAKAAMRRKDYAYALLLLLDADEEFSKCSGEILRSVDNFALLCLDISWCYLCLQSIGHLPDAEMRLKTCEECLQRSYGRNLERLQALKGGVANELALLMRLHLLQGIVAFHKRDFQKAATLFTTAEGELRNLHVDDGKLSYLMSLGYHATESRLALRNCSGHIEMAVSQIIQKREEREERWKKEAIERKKKKLAHKLGMTDAGEWINVDMYDSLVGMGFSKAASKEALKQANNMISMAVQLLQENPQLRLLQEAGSSSAKDVSDMLVAQVTSLGFDPIQARAALLRMDGNLQNAIEALILHEGIIPPEDSSSSSSDDSIAVRGPPSEELQQAFKRLKADVPEDEEAHLDFTLEEEAQILEEYKVKMASRDGNLPGTSHQS